MRAFLAIEISESARRALIALEGALQKTGADVKWVEPDNLHLTLKFLGDISESQLGLLKKRLGEIASSFDRFSIRLRKLGAFPSFQRPRIVWVGIDEGKQDLVRLVKAIETLCIALGLPAEKRVFEPHLTLGRVRSARGLEKLIAELKANADFGCSDPIEAVSVTLFESTLSSRGPTYRPLEKMLFRNS